MGIAALKKKAKKAELLQHLFQQEDPDVIQLPLQEDDGWFRGSISSGLSNAGKPKAATS